MPKRQTFFVLQNANGEVVAGSELNDKPLQDEADRIGGVILSSQGDIVYDASFPGLAESAAAADRAAVRGLAPHTAALVAAEVRKAVDGNRV